MPETKQVQIPAFPPNRPLPRQEITTFVLGVTALIIFILLQVFEQPLDAKYNTLNHNHISLHAVLEFASVFVSFSIAMQGWMVFTHTLSKQRLLFACSFLAIGMLDLLHTLTFPGMPFFVTETSVNVPTSFWIAARLTEGLMLLLIMAVSESTMQGQTDRRNAFSFAIVYMLLLSSTIYLLDGRGYPLLTPGGAATPVKNTLEYLSIGMHGVAFLIVFYTYMKFRFATALNVMLACLLLVLTELLMTTFANPFGIHHLVGHIFKFLAFMSFLTGFYFATYKQPYQELKQKQKQLFTLTSSLGEGIFVKTVDGKLKFINPEAERLLGWTEEDLKGQDLVAEIFAASENGRSIFEESSDLYKIMQAGACYRNEDDTFRRKDGSCLPVSYTVTPIIEQGAVTAYVTVFRDITERKRAEQQMLESETKYKLISDNSLDMITKLTPQGICFYVSPACRSLLGYEPEELIGHNGLEFYHPDDLPKIMTEHAQILEAKKILTSPYRFRKKDGTYIWLETTAQIIEDEASGEIKEVLAIARDITDRQLQMEAIEKLTTQNRLILDSVEEGIFGTGLDQHIYFYNPAAARMLGYDERELLGKRPIDTFNPFASVNPVDYHVQFEAKGFFSAEGQFFRKDGTTFPAEYTVTPVYDNGVLVGIVSTFADISGRKQAEQLVEERRQIDLEYSLASRVQKSLLQEADVVQVPAGTEIGVTSFPVRKLNGDFYNFTSNENSFNFGVADISGKGMPAAILMSMVKFAMDEFSKQANTPNFMLEVLNRYVYRYTDSSMFVTMFIGSYDKRSSRFYYSSAGHEPAILYKAAAGEAVDLHVEGTVLGLTSDQIYGVQSVVLEPGDMILMYTDGLTENRSNPEADSNDILKQLLREVDLSEDSQSIVTYICKRVTELHGWPTDDQTLLLFRRVE